MTNKQKALAKKIVANPSLTMSEAMRQVGYSEASVTKPSEVTNSIGWKQLMDKMLPDEKLLLRHAEGLDATKIHTSHTEPDREVTDYAVRKQYVELGYKLKKYLTPDNQINVLNNGEMGVNFILEDNAKE